MAMNLTIHRENESVVWRLYRFAGERPRFHRARLEVVVDPCQCSPCANPFFSAQTAEADKEDGEHDQQQIEVDPRIELEQRIEFGQRVEFAL